MNVGDRTHSICLRCPRWQGASTAPHQCNGMATGARSHTQNTWKSTASAAPTIFPPLRGAKHDGASRRRKSYQAEGARKGGRLERKLLLDGSCTQTERVFCVMEMELLCGVSCCGVPAVADEVLLSR